MYSMCPCWDDIVITILLCENQFLFGSYPSGCFSVGIIVFPSHEKIVFLPNTRCGSILSSAPTTCILISISMILLFMTAPTYSFGGQFRESFLDPFEESLWFFDS